MDLTLTQSINPSSSLLIGDSFNVTLSFRNWGLQSANAVTVSQVLQAGLTYTSTAPAGWFTLGWRMPAAGRLSSQLDNVCWFITSTYAHSRHMLCTRCLLDPSVEL